MPDDQKGSNVAEEKQPASMPEANQTVEVKEDELPTDATERTREQFEKLKQSNQELKERLRQLEEPKPTSILDSLNPQLPEIPIPPKVDVSGLSQNQVDGIAQNLIDKDGYLDEKLFKQTIRELQQEVRAAKEEAIRIREEVRKTEEDKQVRSAHKKYPMLDPKDPSFNPDFFEAVKNELVGQMINGKKDLVAAADKVAKWMKPTESSNPAEANQDKKQEQLRQINATGSSSAKGNKQYSITDESELVRRTRLGDREALLERLKRAEG